MIQKLNNVYHQLQMLYVNVMLVIISVIQDLVIVQNVKQTVMFVQIIILVLHVNWDIP